MNRLIRTNVLISLNKNEVDKMKIKIKIWMMMTQNQKIQVLEQRSNETRENYYSLVEDIYKIYW